MSEPATAPGRVRPAVVVSLVAVALALAWALVGFRLVVVPHEYAEGVHGYPIPAGGDHMYYASTMLQYAGTPYAESLRETADKLDYPLAWQRLSVGYLSPAVAPLVYPRTTLPLVGALFEPVLGIWAITVPGILAALALPGVMYVAARRLHATRWLAVPLVLLLLTRLFDEYGTGVYTEPLVGLFVVGAAATLPWDRRRPSIPDLCWLAFFVLAGSLTRQIGPAFAGLVVGAAAWGLLFGADRRAWWARWWRPAAVATAVATVTTVVVQVWAPYDVLAYAAGSTGAATRREGLLRSLERIPSVFRDGVAEAWSHGDRLLLLLVALGVLAIVVAFRHPLTGGVFGCGVPMLVTVGLNGHDAFRYTEPALLLVVLLIAVAMARTWPARPVEPAAVAGADGAARLGHTLAWSLPPVLLGVVLVGASIAVYRPAPPVPVGTLTATDVTGTWPLTVRSLDLVCGGDDGQVWGTTPSGQRVSVTGTAMARALGTPSVESLALSTAMSPNAMDALVRAAVTRCPVPVPMP